MEKLLTIVIPAYNAEKYLEKCLQSMLAQPTNLLEILVIDDGSTDQTRVISDKFASAYPDIVRVIHKTNGGWGSGINLAIQEAKGVFFKIVDADDWLAEGSLPRLLELLQEQPEEVDMVATNYFYFWAGIQKTELQAIAPTLSGKTLSLSDLTGKYTGKWGTPIHAITHRTELLRRINLRVNERYYADLEYILLPLSALRKIHFSELAVSFYYRGDEGQSTSTTGYCRHYRDLLKVVSSLAKAFEASSASSGIKLLMLKNILPQIQFSYYLLMHPAYLGGTPEAKENLRDFDRELKTISPVLYNRSLWLTRRCVPYILLYRWLHLNAFMLSDRK